MNNEIAPSVIEKIKSIVLDIDINSVLSDANSAGLNVSAVQDFRNQAHNYWRIEDIMHSYAGLAARYSAISGATAGIGGISTSLAIGGVDILNMASQLYRLGQRLSVLNGFDPNDPIQNAKITEIYLCALGFDAAAQAVIKSQLIKAASVAGKRGAYNDPVIKLIIYVAKKLGQDITSKQAAKYIPVVGLVAGATMNYTFARKAANNMLESYKKEYFRTWQAEQRQ